MNDTVLDDDTLLRLLAYAPATKRAEALGLLYDRYSRLIYGISLHMLGEQTLAEEVTQDVFLRAWEHAATYHPAAGKVSTWLAGITRHRAIDVLRRQSARAEGHSISLNHLDDFEPPSSQNIENETELVLQQQRIRHAMQELPIEQRHALALAYFHGLTQEEIAQALGQPLGTIKTRIRLGMQKLRQLLQE
jgi:RNA polymerase sigma-70 factor, ECF subfamily